MWWWLAARASAGQYQMLEPAGTLETDEGEMGGGVGVGATLGDELDLGSAVVSGWSRYGLTDHLEVGGGAWMPVAPFDLGVHGGARLRLLGAPDGDGPQLSTGVVLGASLFEPKATFAVTVPATVGVGVGTVDVYGGPAASYLGWLGAVLLSAHAGVGVDAGGIPVYVEAQGTRVLGFTVVTASVGFGYRAGS